MLRRLRQLRRPRRPQRLVKKVPESAFFEDSIAAAGDKSRWKRLPIPVSLLICLITLSLSLYTGVPVSRPPQAVVEAALQADTGVVDPDMVLVRRGFGYYSVVLLGSSQTAPYSTSAWLQITGSGQVLSVEYKYGVSWSAYWTIIGLEYVGVLACLAGLWHQRAAIRQLLRPHFGARG